MTSGNTESSPPGEEVTSLVKPKIKVGLVLGAGGPVGHAFHVGVLHALQRTFGWDPREAWLVVGTSAGSQVAALLRAGMQPADMVARVTGDAMTDEGQEIAQHYHRPATFEADGPRKLRPSSLRYLGRVLRRPWEPRPGRIIAALLPEGRVCSQRQVDGLRRLFGHGWPDPHTWITSVRLHTGEPVAFGRPGHPQTDLGTAVACSCAVPSIKAPIEVDGEHYIDGGIVSATHLDLLRDADVDLVVASSPLSRLAPTRMLFRREVRRLRRAGKTVVTFEPEGPTRWAMGLNPLSYERGPSVSRMAYASTLHTLRTEPAYEVLRELG